MKPSLALLALLPLLLSSALAQAEADRALGFWSTEEDEAVVELFACGQGLCGRIVALKEMLDAQGAPLRDAANPVGALRSRPLCGLPILAALKPRGAGSYDGGTIYNPENGKTYSASLQLEGDAAQVTGYIGVKLLGEQQSWTRAKGGFKRCDGTPSQGAR